MATRNTGAFDSRHQWTGGDLPEAESEQFQRGKSEALDRLLRFTGPDADEAGAVVLTRNGEIFDFQVGVEDEVLVTCPSAEEFALLHSHPNGFPQSLQDWANLLTLDGIQQSHVITAKETYSLHKPVRWSQKILSESAEGAIEEIFSKCLKTVAEREKLTKRNLTEEQFYEQATHAAARYFRLIFRIGKRS